MPSSTTEVLVPLGTVAICQYGLSEPADPNGERLYIGMGQLQNGRVVPANANRLTVSKQVAARYGLLRGDVLFNRTNSLELVGKTAIVNDVFLEGSVFASYLVRLQVDAQKYDSRFLTLWMNTADSVRRLRRLATPGVAQYNIRPSLLASKFLVPAWPLPRQRLVADIYELFERLATNLESQVRIKQVFKRGLMQQLLAGQKRFPEFRDRPWTFHRFDALCEELSDRNGKQIGADRVMGVIKGVGFEPMRERVRGKGDLARYKVVPPGAFAYNPMRLNIGSIAFNDSGRSILVSPDYVVFRARTNVAAPEFINQLRYSSYWTGFMKRAGAGSVRVRIYFSDLARLRVPTPALDEQKRIADALRLVDAEISQFAKLHELREDQKASLLSRLLNGQLSVRAR